MITKKKGLYLGLLVLLLGIGNAMQAYTVTIKNSTSHTVKFKLGFVSGVIYTLRCGSKTKKLKAGRIAKIKVKSLCIVKSLEATVRRSGQPAVKANFIQNHESSFLNNFLYSSLNLTINNSKKQ